MAQRRGPEHPEMVQLEERIKNATALPLGYMQLDPVAKQRT